MIKRKSNADPFKTSSDISHEIEQEYNIKVSRQTVSRRLKTVGLNGRVACKKPWVSANNRRARLEFAKAHKDWDAKNWSRVVWSDESKFCLFGSDGRRYVRRPVGKKFDPKYTKMTVKHGGGNVMVYGCFTSSGVGPLVRVDGKMDSIQFRDILRDVTVPFYNKKYRRKGCIKWIMIQNTSLNASLNGWSPKKSRFCRGPVSPQISIPLSICGTSWAVVSGAENIKIRMICLQNSSPSGSSCSRVSVPSWLVPCRAASKL